MNEKNNKNHHLTLRNLISESLLRDIILFMFLFLIIISQAWDNIFLLLFPLITFTFSLFFRILNTNKRKTEFENSLVIYNPLGLEGKNANRFFFSSLFQLILIFWLGAESLYNPHLINSYMIYFTGFFVFFYTFAFFWIFIDIWKYTKIEIITDPIEEKIDSQFSGDLRNIISFLKFKNFRLSSLITFLIFLILNIVNLIFNILLFNFPNLGMQYILPSYQPIILSYFFFGILIIPPVLSIILLTFNYIAVNNFSKEKLDKIIEPLPRNLQIKIIENLKALSNKIKKQLNSE